VFEGNNSFFADTIDVQETEALIYYSVPVQKLMDISSPSDIVSSQDNFILKFEWYVACYDSMSTIYSNHRDVEITISNLGIDDMVVLPNEYNLFSPYPNPFNPITVIKYAAPEAGQISISIYDIRGREIAKLYNGSHMPGYHTITWDASEYSNGIYFVDDGGPPAKRWTDR
jgi:hypothetical protein